MTFEIAATIDAIRLAPARRLELVGLLQEQSPVYRGLGSSEADRVRGYVLASFEIVGLPQGAVSFVLEELEIGRNPYVVAAAARALRGAAEVPQGAIGLLVRAAQRIEKNDDYVQYDSLRPTAAPALRTTALAEVFRTIAVIGSGAASVREALDAMAGDTDRFSPTAATALKEARRNVSAAAPVRSCCAAPADRVPPVALVPDMPMAVDVGDIALTDQSGAALVYRDFFAGRPSVVTFFYTRCMNPEKCSLTISRLANLQRSIRRAGLQARVNLGAFTYDPGYDSPERLRTYGHERGLKFDGRCKLMRTLGPFEPFQAAFELAVGFGPSTVNRHSVELFVLGAAGAVRQEFRRARWAEVDVFQAVESLV